MLAPKMRIPILADEGLEYFRRRQPRNFSGWEFADLFDTLEDMSASIDKDPAHCEAYFNRGLLYLRKKAFSKGVSDFTRVIKLDPQNVFARYHRGVGYLEMGIRGKEMGIRGAASVSTAVEPQFLKHIGWAVRDMTQAVELARSQGLDASSIHIFVFIRAYARIEGIEPSKAIVELDGLTAESPDSDILGCAQLLRRHAAGVRDSFKALGLNV